MWEQLAQNGKTYVLVLSSTLICPQWRTHSVGVDGQEPWIMCFWCYRNEPNNGFITFWWAFLTFANFPNILQLKAIKQTLSPIHMKKNSNDADMRFFVILDVRWNTNLRTLHQTQYTGAQAKEKKSPEWQLFDPIPYLCNWPISGIAVKSCVV